MNLPSEKVLLERNFDAQGTHLCTIRRVVRETTERSGCSETCTELIVIAVNEACMNIIQHGYNSKPGGNIILEIRQSNDNLIIRLRDFAEPIEPSKVKPRDLQDLRPGGLGTHFIREAMDDIKFLPPPDGVGNLLQMVKRIT